MERAIDSVLKTYLNAYGTLIAIEPADENSATLSFPFHLAGSHRIEITVTDLGKGRYIISDGAKTIGEMKNAGYSIDEETKERLVTLTKLPGLRAVKDYLLLETSYADLGAAIQRFLEASKTIGDVYLVHRSKVQPTERELIERVKGTLNSRHVLYRERVRLRGHLEDHPFDLVAPPNGRPGLAVSILSGHNTHTLAQVWAYKCVDIREETANARTKLVLVYDVKSATWSDISKRILADKADITVSGDSVNELGGQLEKHGVI